MFALWDFWKMQKSAKIVSWCLFVACIIVESFWYTNHGFSDKSLHSLGTVSRAIEKTDIIDTAFAQGYQNTSTRK